MYASVSSLFIFSMLSSNSCSCSFVKANSFVVRCNSSRVFTSSSSVYSNVSSATSSRSSRDTIVRLISLEGDARFASSSEFSSLHMTSISSKRLSIWTYCCSNLVSNSSIFVSLYSRSSSNSAMAMHFSSNSSSRRALSALFSSVSIFISLMSCWSALTLRSACSSLSDVVSRRLSSDWRVLVRRFEVGVLGLSKRASPPRPFSFVGVNVKLLIKSSFWLPSSLKKTSSNESDDWFQSVICRWSPSHWLCQ